MARRRKRQWKTQESTHKRNDNSRTIPDNNSLAQVIPSCHAPSNRRLESSSLMPRWTPWVVTLMTFAIRVYHVIDPKNWWVLHPDEIYQSMEVAHSELYGYGHRPYEFIPPHKGDNLSHYQLRELSLGMNALRSPILLQYLVLVTWFAHTIGLDVSNPYLVFRLSHVAVTSLLPLAVFKFTKAACRCPDVASVAAILTGTSAYLSTLGSHTLINSFVSPAIFFGLAAAVRVLQGSQRRPASLLSQNSKKIDYVFSKNNDVQWKSNCDHKTCGTCNSIHNSQKEIAASKTGLQSHEQNHNTWIRGENQYIRTGSLPQKPSCPTDKEVGEEEVVVGRFEGNSNFILSESDTSPTIYPSVSTSEDQGYVSRASRTSSSSSSSNGSTSTIYDESGNESDCYESCRAINENTEFSWARSSSSLTSTKGSSAFQLHAMKTEDQSQLSFSISNIFSGIMLSVAVYVRPDTILLVGSVLLGNHKPSRTISLLRSWSAWQMALGGVIGLILAGTNDANFYNCFVLSPINWARMNVFSGLASKLFGASSWNFYLLRVFLRDDSMCVASFLFVVTALLSIYEIVSCSLQRKARFKYIQSIAEESICELRSPQGMIHNNESLRIHIMCVVILTSVYSCMAHKEERFLHDTVVLFFIAVSQAMLRVVNFLVRKGFTTIYLNRENPTHDIDDIDQHVHHKERQSTRLFLVFLFSSVFVAFQIHSFTAPFDVQGKQWHKSSTPSDLDTTMCLYFSSQQSDISGLFVDRNIKNTGGYSMLHKNIPLFHLLGRDFIEFTNASLVKEKRACIIDSVSPTEAKIKQGKASGSSNKAINRSRANYVNKMNGVNSYIDDIRGDSIKDEDIYKTLWDEGRSLCEVGYFSINTASDLIHKDNTVGILRKIIGVLDNKHTDKRQFSKSEMKQQQYHQNQQQQRQYYPNQQQQYYTNQQQQYHQNQQQQYYPNQQQQYHQNQQQQQHAERLVPHYNYAIVEADKSFLSPAFRPVYRTATMWVWKRVNTPHTEARLVSTLYHIQAQSQSMAAKTHKVNIVGEDMETQKSNNAEAQAKSVYIYSQKHNISQRAKIGARPNNGGTAESRDSRNSNIFTPKVELLMEYEAETLKQLGNYWAATNRFEAIALTSRGHDLQGKVKVNVLVAMVFCLHRLGEKQKLQTVLDECMASYSRDQCLDGWRSSVPKLTSPKQKAA